MPITKWKNIMLEPNEAKRNKKIKMLTEEDAKAFLMFIITLVMNGGKLPQDKEE